MAETLNTTPPLLPELLSSDELLTYINMRYSSIRNLKDKSHSQLVDIYRQMILPKAQREYKHNRRGRLLTKKRKESGLQNATIEGAVQVKSSVFLTARTTTTNSPTALKRNSHDRLKPPPELSESRRIRLSSADSTSDGDASSVQTETLNKAVKERANKELKKRKEDSSDEAASKPKRMKITWP